MTKPHIPMVRVEVSHDECMGVSMCTQAAPRAFRLNAVGKSVYQGDGTATVDQLRAAAAACPMAAIKLLEGEAHA